MLSRAGLVLIGGSFLVCAAGHAVPARAETTTAGTTTMACQFTAGPMSGTAASLAPRAVPASVGAPCTDNAGSTGHVTVAALSTTCGFVIGPMAGTRFDLARYGVSPLPVGTPCTDNGGSIGTMIPDPNRQ